MNQVALFCIILLPLAVAVGELPIYQGCGETIRDVPDGIIDYPGNELRYPNNANCSWIISLDEDERMEVSFQRFKINIRDKLFIKDQGTFSGNNKPPPTFITSGNELILNFITTAKHRNKGFKLTWKKIINTEICEPICENGGRTSPVTCTCEIGRTGPACEKVSEPSWCKYISTDQCTGTIVKTNCPSVCVSEPRWCKYIRKNQCSHTNIKTNCPSLCDKTACNPAICEFDNGVAGNCSRFPIDNSKNVSSMQCKDGCDCWINDQSYCNPTMCKMVNGVVGNCSLDPIENFKNVGPMQCTYGCNCWIPAKPDCNPAVCTMENGVVGKCSPDPIDNFKNVGPMECKDGCECWIPGDICETGINIGHKCLKFSMERMTFEDAAIECAKDGSRLAKLADIANEVLQYTIKEYAGIKCDGFTPSYCLKFSEEELTWEEAVNACADIGGELASPSEYAAEQLRDYAVTHYESFERFWVGGSDAAVEGTWEWLNKEPIGYLFPWYPGEPSDYVGNENCMELDTSFRGFGAAPCDVNKRYICELETSFWAGGSDIAKEGSWEWLNKEPFEDQFPWLPNQPDNAGNNEDCLELSARDRGYGIGYNDLPCDHRIRYICELDSTVSRYYGPFTKIWSDDQCKEMGQYSDKSLTECGDICDMLVLCTALNFNKEDKTCVLRQCALPVPQPIFNNPPWMGYSKSIVSASYGIVYKYTSYYNMIWTSEGSDDGSSQVGIWAAGNYQPGYCALGDVATYGYDPPITKALLVSSKNSGALVNPTGFTLVWTDLGRRSASDCAVYTMHAPDGYTCLGGVAVRSHTSQPNKKNYCCVKDEYIIRGEFVRAYTGGGSHAKSLWTIVRGPNALGLDGGNFLPVIGDTAPATGYLLKWDGVKVRDMWSIPDYEEAPLNLYEISEFKKIWDDNETQAIEPCSIWRPIKREGQHSIGDIVVNSRSQPSIGYVAKPSDPKDHDSLRPPVSYSMIWSTAGSHGGINLKIWRVNCPGGFIALGNVATAGNDPYPALGSIYCVNGDYILYGSNDENSWKKVWANHGSGAVRDVTIYEAITKTHRQQTVKGFDSIASYDGYPGTPYLLDKGKITYYAEPPIKKIYLYNVHFNLNSERKLSKPVQVFKTDIENFSDQTQSAHRTMTVSVEESFQYEFSVAVEKGTSVEASASVTIGAKVSAGAFGVEAEASTSVEAGVSTSISESETTSFTSGETHTTSTSDTITADITLPPRSKITAYITANEYKADIPYTATIKKEYFDGGFSYGKIDGIYKGVAIAEHIVTYGEVEYFD